MKKSYNWNTIPLSLTARNKLEGIGKSLRRTTNRGSKGPVLFYGPGLAKENAAALIGETLQQEIYHVDLAAVISNYIGETEKNLDRLFKSAEEKNWILFFDEADALFGKRTDVRDSHDRYANQEAGYLLQKIEDFPGLVLLASNLKSSIDPAFIRRFRAGIYFKKTDD